MYVEGVNRKSRILFSFQLLLIDDNEMRELEEEEPCLKMYTCTCTWTSTALYMHISIIHVSCHGNNRFSIFVHVHVQCMSPCRLWNIPMDFLSVHTPHFLRLWLDTRLIQMSDCCRLQSIPPYSCLQDWESDRDSGAMPLPPGPSQSHLPLPRLTSPVDPPCVCQRPHHL